MSLKSLHILLLLLATTLLSACGGAGTTTPAENYETVSTTTYKVAYIPVTATAEGKTTYKIRLTNKNDNSALTGKTISLTPTMYMATYSHSTPCTTLTDNNDGTYSGTLYYNMASIAADGSSMGKWELEFTVNGETATFNPTVTMSTGSVAKLKGVTDTIASMTMGAAPVSRTYQVFNDGISGSTVKLFITAVDDAMMMKFPAVSAGTTLHSATNADVAVTSMMVEFSTDKTAWTALTDNGSGYWFKSGLPVMAAGSVLYVKLSVNGEQKTTDGKALAADGANGYQSLIVAGI